MKLPRRRFYRRKPKSPWVTALQWIGIAVVGLTLFNIYASSRQLPPVQLSATSTPSSNAADHIEQAEQYFAANAFSAAAAEYDRAIRLDPTNMAVWIAASQTHTYARESDLALDAANTAIVLDSDDPRPWAVRALALDWLHRYEEARDDALKALDNDPNHVLALAVLAKVSVDLDDFGTAVEMLRRAQSHDPNDLEAMRAAAYIAENVPDPATGLPDFLTAIDIYRSINDSGVQLGWVHIRLGLSYRAAGDFDSAVGSFRRAQELYPDSAEPLVGLSRMYTQIAEYDMALEVLEEARTLDPTSRDVYGRRGILEYRLDNYDQAFFFLNCVVDGCDHPDQGIVLEPAELNRFTLDYFSDYSLLLTERGDCDRGLVMLNNLVNFAPADPNVLQVRDLGYEYCGQTFGPDDDPTADGEGE